MFPKALILLNFVQKTEENNQKNDKIIILGTVYSVCSNCILSPNENIYDSCALGLILFDMAISYVACDHPVPWIFFNVLS